MKLIILFLSLITFSGIAQSGTATNPSFTISSECVESIKVDEIEDMQYWRVIIILKHKAAKALLAFSSQHIRKSVSIINGDGIEISVSEVMEPISSPFNLVGISRSKANEIRDAILASKGACGDANK